MAKTYTVSDIARNLNTIIDKHLGELSILVEGEISNLVIHSSQHIYFNLKDEQSSIACFINKTTNLDRSFLKNGNNVLLQVKIKYNSLKNETRLYVLDVKLFGEGLLFAQLQKLKYKLEKQGLFDEKHKKSLPEYPQSIGIITAVPSAALKDVLVTINNKCPIVDIKIYPTLVQGKQASSNIIQQLLVADIQNHDILLLVRGGGSIEDLWCFNNEELCNTIFQLNTPIISGIGHQQDYTLADFVVDKRSATPSAAANDAVYSLTQVQSELNIKVNRLYKKIQSKFEIEKDKYTRFKNSSIFSNPESLIKMDIQKIRLFDEKMRSYCQFNLQIKKQLEHKKILLHKNISQVINLEKLKIKTLLDKLVYLNKKIYEKNIAATEKYHSLLNAYSHTKILERGYSIIKKNGKIINNIKQLELDDEIELILSSGKLKAKVSDKNGE